MITARGEETDRVVGLELGADDYVCKPFSVRELMARIKAVLRRRREGEKQSKPRSVLLSKAGLRLDTLSREATLRGVALPLTRLEFDLLFLLLNNVGRVLSREHLLHEAWGYDFVGDTRTVDSAIKRLRAKLRQASDEMNCIETVRGVGYRVTS
jgi:two-component system alkaline phosphatase synthesis response regulator PhoP